MKYHVSFCGNSYGHIWNEVFEVKDRRDLLDKIKLYRENGLIPMRLEIIENEEDLYNQMKFM